MVTQIPGGILAERFGGKWVFGIGTLLTALFTLLTPVAARSSTTALIVVRVLTGLAEVALFLFFPCLFSTSGTLLFYLQFGLQGVTYPSVNNLLSKWVPTLERTTFGAFVLAGRPNIWLNKRLKSIIASIEA